MHLRSSLSAAKHMRRQPTNFHQNLQDSKGSTDQLIDWGLTALSAQIGDIVPLKSMLRLKSEINEKVDYVGNTYNKPMQ